MKRGGRLDQCQNRWNGQATVFNHFRAVGGIAGFPLRVEQAEREAKNTDFHG